MKRRTVWLAVFVLPAFCSLAAELRAARLIHLEVELDGRIVLQGLATDGGDKEPAFVWLYFHSTQLRPEGEFVMPAVTGHPPQSTIKGHFKIRAKHANRVLAEAVVDSLTLRPFPNEPSGWQVTPDEVTRTAKLANLSLPDGEAMTGPGVLFAAAVDHPLVTAILIGAFVFVIVATLSVFLIAKRRSSSGASS